MILEALNAQAETANPTAALVMLELLTNFVNIHGIRAVAAVGIYAGGCD